MRVFTRDGVNFVTDLIWQKQSTLKRPLKTYRADCRFEYYCRNNHFAPIMGFGREVKDQDGKLVVIKNPISLAIFILESIDLQNKNVDLFIVFRFSPPPAEIATTKEARDFEEEKADFGYVLLLKGCVAPIDGEYIGTLPEVETKIIEAAKRYEIKMAYIAEDVSLAENQAFKNKAGIEISVIKHKLNDKTSKFLQASETRFWQSKNRKYKIATAKIKTMKSLDKQRNMLIGVGVLAFLAIIGSVIKSYYFTDNEVEKIVQKVAPPPPPTAYTAYSMISACLTRTDQLIINTEKWQTTSMRCNSKGIDMVYKSVNGGLEELAKLTGESTIVYNQNGATLHVKLSAKTIPAVYNGGNLTGEVDQLNDIGRKMNIKVQISQNKFTLSSPYSPVFLYQNGIINQYNLSEINMSQDQTGFMKWDIKGEFNVPPTKN